MQKDDIEKQKENNKKIAKSRIKIGLILNKIAEINKLKIDDNEIKNEIQKQATNMPGQEKMVMDYYQKNPAAISNIRGALFEEKIINHIKSKTKLLKKNISLKEAEDIIKKFSNSEENKNKDTEKINKKPKSKKKK